MRDRSFRLVAARGTGAYNQEHGGQTMDASLSGQFAKLERQKQTLLEQLAEWDSPLLAFRSAPGQWSALEVLDHIVKTESAIVATMRNHAASSRSVSAPDRVRGFLLILLFLTPVRVKAPGSVKAIVPSGDNSFESLGAAWTQTRDELESFLNSVPRKRLWPAVFRHPVAGWMTLPRTLSFLSAHIIHHVFQLRRLAEASQTR